MHIMKKTAVLLPLCCLLLFGFAFCASAAEAAASEETKTKETGDEAFSEPLLSPAIRVLAARCRMKKNNTQNEDTAETGVSLSDAISFSQADFAEVLGYTPSEITVVTLPDRTKGTLMLGTVEIAEGGVLSANAMQYLTFVPSEYNTSVGNLLDIGTEEAAPVSASFTFVARGGAYRTDTPIVCEIHILPENNGAPIPVSLAVNKVTYTESALHGKIMASDPEADRLTYSLVRMPKKGSVTLDGESGAYIYTPTAGKRGSDVFTCRVTDVWGNRSELCSVRVEIRRAGEALCYADMEDSSAISAAMYVTEMGIMSGQQSSGIRLFSPDDVMTRGEFLIAAMKAAEREAEDVAAQDIAAVFSDFDEIPAYMRPYVLAAYADGVIGGSVDESGNTVFASDAEISYAEAAVILAGLFDLRADDHASTVFAESDVYREDVVPAWSASAVTALGGMGISARDGVLSPLTRGEAAEMLTGVMVEKQ